MRTVRTLALLALPVLFFSVLYVGTASQAQSQRHPDSMEWDVPATWVEFTANVTMRDPNQTVRGTGRVYQNEDGSRREEWLLGDRRRIEIENATLNLYFTATDRKQSWTVQPWSGMEGRRPGRSDPSQEKLEGHALTEALTPDFTLYFAPSLAPDYAVRQVGTNGAVTELSNIKIGPVPDQLFTPPPGAMTQFFQQWGGKSVFVKATPAERQAAAKLPPNDRNAYWKGVYARKGTQSVIVEADK